MAETKQCPDCAEQVLAAARKCRFCGYRFDRGRRSGGALADLLAGLRRENREVTLDTLLADWDVSLDDGEEARLFRLAELDGRVGYLLVTGTRLVFFAARGRNHHDKVVESALGEISSARVHRSLSSRQVVIAGAGWEHAVRLYGREDAERLVELLAEHRNARTSEEPDRPPPGSS